MALVATLEEHHVRSDNHTQPLKKKDQAPRLEQGTVQG
jgi:hypothetical protein